MDRQCQHFVSNLSMAFLPHVADPAVPPFVSVPRQPTPPGMPSMPTAYARQTSTPATGTSQWPGIRTRPRHNSFLGRFWLRASDNANSEGSVQGSFAPRFRPPPSAYHSIGLLSQHPFHTAPSLSTVQPPRSASQPMYLVPLTETTQSSFRAEVAPLSTLDSGNSQRQGTIMEEAAQVRADTTQPASAKDSVTLLWCLEELLCCCSSHGEVQ